MDMVLQDISSEYEGFNRLIALSAQANALQFEVLTIDMSGVHWFNANMCAPFGAILYRISRNLNSVSLQNLRPDVSNILSRNGFLSSYGQEKLPDTYGTTIEYTRFQTKDDRFFGAYVEKHLIGNRLPQMSVGLQKKFRESIFEIFSNAVIHSETELGIFSCGQYFPNKNLLDFSIADLGVGIRENVEKKIGKTLSAEQAIGWAMEGANTTKTGRVPGGLGLKLLREFILQNNGRIQIVSDRGYWQLSNGHVITKRFPHPFPGTVVNIEINTADTKSYCLASEISADNIF